MREQAFRRLLDTPEKRRLHDLTRTRPRQAAAFRQLAALLRADGRYEAAAFILAKGIRRHPDDPSMLAHLARTRREAGDHRRAIALYRRMIRLRPDDPVPYEKIDAICRAAGRYEQAVRLYRSIPAGNPLKERSHERLHFLLVEKMRDLRRGADNLRAAIGSFGPSYRRCKDLGRIRAKRGEWDEAARQYRAALAFKPDDADLLALLGWALVEAGDLAGAERSFERIGGTFQGRIALAELRLRQGRADEAEERLAALRRVYPGSPRVSIGFAEIALLRGDAASARAIAAEALGRVPPYFAFEQARGHAVASEACRRLGDAAAARLHRELAAALRGGADAYTAVITLAERKLAKGDLDGAEAVFTRVLELYPANTRALAGQCEVWLRRGDGPRAAFFGEQALAGASPKYPDERRRCRILLGKARAMGKGGRAVSGSAARSASAGRGRTPSS
ncbi:MAG: tetratricopeptide repeat protein [bacterium]|nr:tetratricopeptide repeat protein [bacterium]